MPPSSVARDAGPSRERDLEAAIHDYGNQLFGLMDAAEPPSLFSKKGFYGTLMDWAMRDEHFKTQLLRFVDVLPTLTSSGEITRHLKEYLGDEHLKLSPALRVGLKAAGGASWLFGAGVKAQVTGMARQFMLGNDEKEIIATLRKLHEQDIGFTVDVLGEAVVSEAEADQYARRYLDLMDSLAPAIARWRHPCRSNESPRGHVPPLNVSVKLSALYSQIHPTDPDTAIERIAARLRPILRRAGELGAFINLDMESYALKDLTLRLFKTVFAEPEFASQPACGLALQAYLKDCEADLTGIIAWAREHDRRVTVRLVKGAYWDYETVIAQQRRWPVPVFAHKWETDANFEKLTLMLLENDDAVDAAFGTHNARSLAHVLAQAERLGRDRRSFELQMLYGMADPIKAAVLQLGCRLREYCPIGELLPGMAYPVRRLLENTSNEGFLANKFAKGTSREELLRDPRDARTATGGGEQRASGSPSPPLEERAGERRPLTTLDAAARGDIPEGDHTDLAGGSAEQDGLLSLALSSRGGEGKDAAASERRDVDREQALTPHSALGTPHFCNEPPTDFTRAAEREKVQAAIGVLRRRIGQRYPLVINHRQVSTPDWLPSLNPANQTEVVGYAAQAGAAEAEAALAAARTAQPAWARTPAEERAVLLERVAALLQRGKAGLCAIEILEAGKSWTEADADVAEAIDFCNYYAAVMRELGRPQRTQAVAGESNVQHWWPRGTGVVIQREFISLHK